MGQSMQSGLTSITGNVTVASAGGTPATVIKNAYNSVGSNGTVTIATVTAGKTAYILGYSLQSNFNGGAGTTQVILQANAVTIDGVYLASGAGSGICGIKSIMFPPGYGFSVAATQTIQIVVSGTSSATNVGTCSIWYIEV